MKRKKIINKSSLNSDFCVGFNLGRTNKDNARQFNPSHQKVLMQTKEPPSFLKEIIEILLKVLGFTDCS